MLPGFILLVLLPSMICVLRTQQLPHKQVILGYPVSNWLEEIGKHLVEYHNFL